VTVAVGALNFVLGAVYLQYGTMTMIEMKRNWGRMGFSHFGAAWIAMAFTCGPHHLAHGEHMLFHGQPGGALDLLAVGVGFPAGVMWFLLRVEAFRGGRGDRFIAGTPPMVAALPLLAGIYAGAIFVGMAKLGSVDTARIANVIPSLMLVILYLIIGYYLTRTQLANRRPLGGWSLSGLSLAIVFPTCAAMHAVFAAYTLSGLYPVDVHTKVIDLLAVPAAIYFVWVVQALYRGTFRDWNHAGRVVPDSAAASAA
jgi:hypothetical protein